MRRNARTLIVIAVLVVVSGLILGIQKIDIAGLERGGDALMGLSLGLDLQGGSHLVYRASLKDPESGQEVPPSKEQMEALRSTIGRRVNASGFGEPIIQLLGDDRLLIQMPGVRDPGRAKSIIGETARLEFKHRTLNVPKELTEISSADIVSVRAGPLPSEEPALGATSTPALEATSTPALGSTSTPGAPGISKPATPQGEPLAGSGPGATEQGDGPVVLLVEFTEEGVQKFAKVEERLVQSMAPALSGSLAPPSRLDISVEGAQPLRFEVTALSMRRIGQSARYAFGFPRDATGGGAMDLERARTLLGDSPKIRFSEIQGTVDEDIGLTGDDLARAYPSQHTASGVPVVSIEFKERGARIFGELTSRIAGSDADQIAIFLDNEELISPVVETAIVSGAAIIQGRDFTPQRTRDIALLLESGRLPVPIELIQERNVDAILGADSLRKSVIAGVVGLALVLLFMTMYYRVPGLVASMSLLIYAGLILAIFKLVPVTLTLSGVAGVILSIGMAVDANVLIFERMKEELRVGRTLLSAINIGFNRAWLAIRDSNVSTLISAGILFWFADQLGTTVVQGFAATLAIGVAVSMFTAITVSRVLMLTVALTPVGRRIGLFVPSGSPPLPQQQLQPSASAAEGS